MKMHHSTYTAALAWSCAVLACLQIPVRGAILTNRYSFNETSGTVASDSVSGKDGALMNTAAFSGTGQVVIAPPYGQLSGDATGPYVALPPNLLTNYSALTMEAWITPTLDDALGGAFWARIWDFGNSDGNVGVNGFIYSRVGNSSFAVLADSFSLATGDSWCFTSAEMLSGQENHFVWTADAATHIAHVYLNGVLAGTSTTFTNSPALVGSTTNDWLGRSQFSGDPYVNASYNEFRVYSGTLSPFEVAADYQLGPDTYPASAGTPNSLQIQISSPIGLGNSAPSKVWAGTTGLTNSLEISLNPEITIGFSSANTNVAKVDALGNVTGVSSGTVNIIASYAGLNATQAVQVVALPTTMLHRYSFNDGTANDSVGSVNGTFYSTSGSASIANGQLNLAGQAGDYVDLGPGVITGTNIPNNAITFEAWATFYPQNGAWTRLFDFGNIAGTVGANYFFFAPNTAANGGNSRLAVSDASPGYNDEAGFNRNNVLGNTNMHVVAVFNPNPSREFLGLYLNGVFVQSIQVPARYQMSTFNDQYSLLGRSLYSAAGDAWLNGSIDEFRIYNGELDKFQIAASHQAGPNNLNFDPGTFVSFSFDAGATNIYLDELRQMTSCALNFSKATNVSLFSDPNLTITASDTNVLTVSTAGVIRAHRVGSVTMTARYQYVVGSTTNIYTTTAPMTVLLPSSELVHRYTFNEGTGSVVRDIVGGADAAIMVATNTLGVTNAVWDAGGQLIINTNTALGAQDTYISLPSGIASSLVSNGTFEAWVTDAASTGWQRVFDFGGRPGSPTNAPDPDIFLTRGPGNTNPRYDWVAGNINSSVIWTNNIQAHFVVLHDGTDGSAKLYMNGNLVDSSAGLNESLSSLSDTNCFLGRSIYSWPLSLPGGYFDPYYQGAFNEFRIYKGLLTEAEIQQDYALGPDQLIINVPLSVHLGNGSITLSWPRYAAQFTLMSRSALAPGGTWTAVTGTLTDTGTSYQMIVPTTGSAQFFRLQR